MTLLSNDVEKLGERWLTACPIASASQHTEKGQLPLKCLCFHTIGSTKHLTTHKMTEHRQGQLVYIQQSFLSNCILLCDKVQETQTQILQYIFLIFINNLSVTKTDYPAKSQNHQLKISKLGFINTTGKNWFVNLHIELQMKLKRPLFNKQNALNALCFGSTD